MAHKVNKEFVENALLHIESQIEQYRFGIFMSCKLRKKIESQIKEIKVMRRKYARDFGGLSTKFMDRQMPELKDALHQRQVIIKNLRGALKEQYEMRNAFQASLEKEEV